uniref:Putative ovule protein n=1 Tax=Solanum chacoense TaxID=4108 RepID=A0A0V0HS78_SOLCH
MPHWQRIGKNPKAIRQSQDFIPVCGASQFSVHLSAQSDRLCWLITIVVRESWNLDVLKWFLISSHIGFNFSICLFHVI